MQIRFHNLGKIKETELDLKPLTVIIGPNNSNKTYIAYSVYGLWQSIGQGTASSSRHVVPFQKASDGELSVTVETLYKTFMANVQRSVKVFEAELSNFYQDSSQSLFSKTRYDIELSMTEFNTVVASLSGAKLVDFANVYTILVQDDRLCLRLVEGGRNSEEYEQPNNYSVGRHLLFMLRKRVISRPYLMPAERNAFIITYKVLAQERLKLMLDAQRRLFSSRQISKHQMSLLREVGEVRYPQPIEDFLDFLFQIENDVQPSSATDEVNPLVSADNELLYEVIRLRRSTRRVIQKGLSKLATDIEENIQSGNKINFRATALGGQEIMVDVGNGLNIDLYNASSSIKQLTPLLLYLRYRAAKGDLLIIDEPEMNLHPESQAKLLEVLAMLVNQGVYVLLTTHSPYIMSHLNTLAQASDVPAATKRKQGKALYLGDPAALLDVDQISAYEMRDNQLHSLKDPDYGIRWDTLSDVSGEIQQKFFQIYEEGHKPERAKPTSKSAKVASK